MPRQRGSAGRRRPLVSLLAADAVSLTGNAMGYVAVPWFVLQTTGSATLTGVAAALTFLPTVLASFFGGAIVDRLGFRRMSIASDLLSGATVALIPLLHVTVGIELWQLFALVFVGALFDAPGTTARRSLLPDLVELAGTRLERATGIAGAIQRGSLLVGAPVAGLLIGTIGATSVLWLDAATFAISALLVWRGVPAPAAKPQGETPGRYLADLREGLGFITRDRFVRTVVLTVLLTNFLDAPIPVLFPVYAEEAFGSAVYLGDDVRRVRRRGPRRLARLRRGRPSVLAPEHVRLRLSPGGASVPRARDHAVAADDPRADGGVGARVRAAEPGARDRRIRARAR